MEQVISTFETQPEKKSYKKPAIERELLLETRAGTPLSTNPIEELMPWYND